jgi:preprotein translocase subunit SecG
VSAVPLIANASWFSVLLNVVIIFVSLVLMFIILIQRGKGGGLAGAFGGAGGSSAFGSRAGDQFLKITLWLAAFWAVMIMVHVRVAKWDNPANQATPEMDIGQKR